MEVLRKKSKNGVIFRIMDDIPSIHYYCIEWLKVYYYDDGTPCDVWNPAFEPKNKCFISWDEVKSLFDEFISGEREI